MPKGYGPHTCVGDCAKDTAQYMLYWGTDLVDPGAKVFAKSNLSCSEDATLAHDKLVRLSPIEYVRSLKDLFELDSIPSLDGFPEEELDNGFLYAESVLAETGEGYKAISEAVATAIVSDYASKTACTLNNENCAKTYISNIAERAFRMPVSTELLESVLSVYEAGARESIQEGVHDSLKLIMQSPFFIYKPRLTIGSNASGSSLDQYKNASKLSYLLTGSIPDKDLWADAKAGNLDSDNLLQHAQRLLAQPETREYLSREFIARWFKVKNATAIRDDIEYTALKQQVDDAITFILNTAWGENGSIERLLTEPAVGDSRTNQLTNDPSRVGLLTQPAWMAAFGSSERTEPILRGVFFVEDMLCREVPTFNGDVMFPEPVAGETLRESLKIHRENPICGNCHALFDPMGIAFENYDQYGNLRTHDGGSVIDASGVFPTTDSTYDFKDANDLLNYVANTEELRYCTAKHWMAYAFRKAVPEQLNCELEGLVDSVKGYSGIDQMIIETLKQTAFFGG